MNNDILKDFRKSLTQKTILKGVVKMVCFDKELGTDVMIMDLKGYKGIVKKEDVDYAKTWKSLVGFIGREISYIVTEIDEVKKVIMCSRALAQTTSLPQIVERLENGEQFMGKIVNFVSYGAFVEIEGGLTGLMKDTSFASDYTKIKDVLSHIGDEIFVKLKNSVEKGDTVEFEFEAVPKYKAPTILNISTFEPQQVVYGEIKKIISNGMFVQIAPGLDALCPIPPFGEYVVEDKVKVRISKVDLENNRVRGRVIDGSQMI